GLEGEAAAAYGRRLSGASMGLIGAVGALGGVGINLAFRQSFLSYGSGTGAFVAFLAYYAACFGVTWAVYLRRPAAQGQAATASEAKPQLSYAEV
ncbi:MAG: MFS transporter, partial [Streptomyces sp.]